MRNRVIIEILEKLICEIKIYDDNKPYLAYVKSVIRELKEEEELKKVTDKELEDME